MKLLITGACGMLGSVVYNYYKDKGHEVYGIDIAENKKSEIINCDITDHNKVELVIRQAVPEIIIHCAAIIDVDKCEIETGKAIEVNYKATANIAYLSYKYNIKLVYISTNMIFSGTEKYGYKECNTAYPLNNYGKTKLWGEYSVMKYSRNYLILRTNIFGWKTGSFGEWLHSNIIKGNKLNLFSDIKFQCVYVKTFVEYIDLLIKHDLKGIYHVTTKDNCSKYDFAKIMINEMQKGSKYKIVKTKYVNLKKKVKRPLKAILDVSKIENDLKIQMPKIKNEISKFLLDDPNYEMYNDNMR